MMFYRVSNFMIFFYVMRFVSVHIFHDFVRNLSDEEYSWDGRFASCTTSDDYFQRGARLRATERRREQISFIRIA